jgi:hypothetical protein
VIAGEDNAASLSGDGDDLVWLLAVADDVAQTPCGRAAVCLGVAEHGLEGGQVGMEVTDERDAHSGRVRARAPAAFTNGYAVVLVFGYLLPADLRIPRAVRAERATESFRGLIAELPAQARHYILQGLLRPDAILVGGYTAAGHRCCPLTSAVWEATGKEARQWDTIMAGISLLGLTGDLHHRFVVAFDEWAAVEGHTEQTPDGLLVLTSYARSSLMGLIERQSAPSPR